MARTLKDMESDSTGHDLINEYMERTIGDLMEGMQGSVIAETLDGLSKELIRLKQERKISVLVRVAEAERRHRECKESGRRQAEECIRNRVEYVHEQLNTTTQACADTLVKYLMDTSVSVTANKRACEEV